MSWILFLQLVLLIVIIALAISFLIMRLYSERCDLEKARRYGFRQ